MASEMLILRRYHCFLNAMDVGKGIGDDYHFGANSVMRVYCYLQWQVQPLTYEDYSIVSVLMLWDCVSWPPKLLPHDLRVAYFE